MSKATMREREIEIRERLDYLYSLKDDRHDSEIIELEEELDGICWNFDAEIY